MNGKGNRGAGAFDTAHLFPNGYPGGFHEIKVIRGDSSLAFDASRRACHAMGR